MQIGHSNSAVCSVIKKKFPYRFSCARMTPHSEVRLKNTFLHVCQGLEGFGWNLEQTHHSKCGLLWSTTAALIPDIQPAYFVKSQSVVKREISSDSSSDTTDQTLNESPLLPSSPKSSVWDRCELRTPVPASRTISRRNSVPHTYKQGVLGDAPEGFLSLCESHLPPLRATTSPGSFQPTTAAIRNLPPSSTAYSLLDILVSMGFSGVADFILVMTDPDSPQKARGIVNFIRPCDLQRFTLTFGDSASIYKTQGIGNLLEARKRGESRPLILRKGLYVPL